MSRHRHRVLLAAICCLLVPGAASRAAVSGIVKTTSPMPASAGEVINQSIADQLTKLANDDPAIVKGARDGLIADADTAAANATSAYQTAYASALAKAIAPLVSDHNQRTRINAAIVVGEVAARVERSGAADQLTDVTKIMLQSKEMAVALWGLKSAQYVLADTLQKTSKDGGLDKLIVATVENFSDPAGAMISVAYDALTLKPLSDAGPQNPVSKLASVTLPDLLDLIEWRVGQYHAGGEPANVLAEERIDAFLPLNGLNAVRQNPQIQQRTLRVLGELACAQLTAISNGVSDQDLVDAIRAGGSALSAFGEELSNAELSTAGQSIERVTIATNPNSLNSLCKTLADSLKSMNVTLSQS